MNMRKSRGSPKTHFKRTHALSLQSEEISDVTLSFLAAMAIFDKPVEIENIVVISIYLFIYLFIYCCNFLQQFP